MNRILVDNTTNLVDPLYLLVLDIRDIDSRTINQQNKSDLSICMWTRVYMGRGHPTKSKSIRRYCMELGNLGTSVAT